MIRAARFNLCSAVRQRPHLANSRHPFTVFCDFDGPLVDVSERYYSTYRMALADLKAGEQPEDVLFIHSLSKEQFWQMKRSRTPDREIALRSGLSGRQIDEFLDCVRQRVNQPELLHQDCLQPSVRYALSLLHSYGARLVLVTLRCQSQVTQLLQDYGLEHFFTLIRGTQDCGAAYINSAEYKTQLLQDAWDELVRRGERPQQACMIGDTEADVLAGHALGIPAIALTCGIRSQSYLSKFEPTAIHEDLLAAVHEFIDANHHAVQVG